MYRPALTAHVSRAFIPKPRTGRQQRHSGQPSKPLWHLSSAMRQCVSSGCWAVTLRSSPMSKAIQETRTSLCVHSVAPQGASRYMSTQPMATDGKAGLPRASSSSRDTETPNRRTLLTARTAPLDWPPEPCRPRMIRCPVPCRSVMVMLSHPVFRCPDPRHSRGPNSRGLPEAFFDIKASFGRDRHRRPRPDGQHGHLPISRGKRPRSPGWI